MFDVVTEKDIFESQRALANEMAPEIEGYIARAEDGLEELKQRERALQSKVNRAPESGGASPSGATTAVDMWILPLAGHLSLTRFRFVRAARETLASRVPTPSARLGRSKRTRRAREGTRDAPEPEEPPRARSRPARGKGGARRCGGGRRRSRSEESARRQSWHRTTVNP